MAEIYDVIIIGGGPAGLSAAIYCGRALRKTLIIERKVFGGQIVESDIIENYPGFAEAITPADLMDQMVRQAEKYNVETEMDEVAAITRQGDLWRVELTDDHRLAKAIIFCACCLSAGVFRASKINGRRGLKSTPTLYLGMITSN